VRRKKAKKEKDDDDDRFRAPLLDTSTRKPQRHEGQAASRVQPFGSESRGEHAKGSAERENAGRRSPP
jgi:hypothetical protein